MYLDTQTSLPSAKLSTDQSIQALEFRQRPYTQRPRKLKTSNEFDRTPYTASYAVHTSLKAAMLSSHLHSKMRSELETSNREMEQTSQFLKREGEGPNFPILFYLSPMPHFRQVGMEQ